MADFEAGSLSWTHVNEIVKPPYYASEITQSSTLSHVVADASTSGFNHVVALGMARSAA
jgi:hypothetical protein